MALSPNSRQSGVRERRTFQRLINGLVDTADKIFRTLTVTGLFTTQGGRIVKTRRVTSDTTLLDTDHKLVCDTDIRVIKVTFPAGIDGTNYVVINAGHSNNKVTMIPNGTDPLLGENSEYDIFDDGDEDVTFEPTEGWV